jgi:hypothetical protein
VVEKCFGFIEADDLLPLIFFFWFHVTSLGWILFGYLGSFFVFLSPSSMSLSLSLTSSSLLSATIIYIKKNSISVKSTLFQFFALFIIFFITTMIIFIIITIVIIIVFVSTG